MARPVTCLCALSCWRASRTPPSMHSASNFCSGPCIVASGENRKKRAGKLDRVGAATPLVEVSQKQILGRLHAIGGRGAHIADRCVIGLKASQCPFHRFKG